MGEPQQFMLLDISVDGNLANHTETVNASCCVSDLDDATRQECYDCTITNRILTFGYNFPVLNGLMWWVVSRAKGQVRQVALQAKRAMAREPQQFMLLDISVAFRCMR